MKTIQYWCGLILVLTCIVVVVDRIASPRGARYKQGDNTILIIKTKSNQVYKFPVSEITIFSLRTCLNIETRDYDIYIPFTNIEYYKYSGS
jgi:hypothetical protein